MPALYLSHGAPPVFNDAHWMDQLFNWSRSLPKPTRNLDRQRSLGGRSARRISSPAVGTRLVCDFSGFGRRYFEMTYATPDASALAASRALMSDLEPVHEHPAAVLTAQCSSNT